MNRLFTVYEITNGFLFVPEGGEMEHDFVVYVPCEHTLHREIGI